MKRKPEKKLDPKYHTEWKPTTKNIFHALEILITVEISY